MITEGKLLWSLNKFSQLILSGNVLENWGLKGQMSLWLNLEVKRLTDKRYHENFIIFICPLGINKQNGSISRQLIEKREYQTIIQWIIIIHWSGGNYSSGYLLN